jgi:hypothetical protein
MIHNHITQKKKEGMVFIYTIPSFCVKIELLLKGQFKVCFFTWYNSKGTDFNVRFIFSGFYSSIVSCTS